MLHGRVKDEERDAIRPVGAERRLPVVAEVDLSSLLMCQIFDGCVRFAVTIDVGLAVGNTIAFVGDTELGFAAIIGGIIDIPAFFAENEIKCVLEGRGKQWCCHSGTSMKVVNALSPIYSGYKKSRIYRLR